MHKTKSKIISVVFLFLFFFVGPSTFSQTDLLPDIYCDPFQLYDRDFDTTIVPGRTHLRLSVGAANIGLGRLELIGVTGDFPIDVNQRIYRSDGSFWDRLAGTFHYHETHEHIHFEDWAIYNLREVLPNNGVGSKVAGGGKVSFCVVDYVLYDPTLPNFDGSWYGGCQTLLQGLSVGYMDIYEKELPDQWIDVTDVPAGTYWLESLVDPFNNILESDETNNIAKLKIDLCLNAPAQIPTGDTLKLLRVEAPAWSQVKVDVYVVNEEQLRTIVIPIKWSGDVFLDYDSISTAGHRTEYFDIVATPAKDENNNRMAFQLTSSANLSLPDLEPGSGTVLSIYFTTSFGTNGDSTIITLLPVNGNYPELETGCYGYEPTIIDGIVAISCCNNTRGNINGDFLNETDISDLTFLVDFMFKNGPQVPCEKEADLDGNDAIEITDLTYFVNYLFKGGPAPVSCSVIK